MIKFLKVLAINLLICLIEGTTTWILAGLAIGIACIYNPTIESFFRPSLKHKFFLDNRDLIGFAFDDIQICLMMIFPCALAVTIGLGGKIAYSQTLHKSQRGREFVERVKSLDTSFGRALRKSLGRPQN